MSNDEIRSVIEEALQPERFFVAEPYRLTIERQPREETAWEVFRGHLLDASRTRERQPFESWNVSLRSVRDAASGDVTAEPLLSVKWDSPSNRLHVTRNLLMYGWEAYEASQGVISSRPAQKWMPELVGTIDLDRSRGCISAVGPQDSSNQNRGYPSAANGVSDADSLRAELSTLLLLAVVGTSRLPITSLESPLPAFSLGRLMYLSDDAGGAQPCSDRALLIDRAFSTRSTIVRRAKLLETALRAVSFQDVPQLAERFRQRCREQDVTGREVSGLFHALFNHVALSPYTGFVDNLISLVERLGVSTDGSAVLSFTEVIDVFAYMLRQLARHLTAFDLQTFHNRGANYPDALVLDALLKVYLRLMDGHRGEFETAGDDPEPVQRRKQRRRRAVRQGWLLRKHYEQLPVPDAPTSPGENLRVLPEPFARIPNEQILNPAARNRRLYADDPLEAHLTENGRRILQQSVADLDGPEELRELGTALYLDRPLGVFKEPGAVDRTPLLSYVAFSREIARQRLLHMRRVAAMEDEEPLEHGLKQLEGLPVRGYPVQELPPVERPGVVALEDARKAADDFIFLHTTRSSLAEFLEHYDFEPLKRIAAEAVDWLFSDKPALLIRTTALPAVSESRVVFAHQSGQRSAEPTLRLTAYDGSMQPRLELEAEQRPESPVRYVQSHGQEFLHDGLRVTTVWDQDDDSRQWNARDIRCNQIVLPPRM